ncbi:MAG: amine dehydrogenase [Hyphomicrobiales bacterium]|nr:amine dehydrogenase [Hyphomicrobiales bacterium]
MDDVIGKLLGAFDRAAERAARKSAQMIGRRSALSMLGSTLVGGALVPLLPFDRSLRANAAEGGRADATEEECDYWRYCALDGFLCSCCGGSVTACPPGAEPSKVTWVGTCHNAKDGKDYIVSYNDCCGKTTCGRCQCNTNLRERPGYRMGVHNDINWCMANTPSMYHCTVSVIVGVSGKG